MSGIAVLCFFHTDHLVDDYEYQTTRTPQQYLAPCERCAGWNSGEYSSTNTSTPKIDAAKGLCDHHCINYNGPVTNHIYNISTNEELDRLRVCKCTSSDTSKDTPSYTHNISFSKPPGPSHNHSSSPEPPQQDSVNNSDDILQNLGNRLFDVFPYFHLQTLYHGKTKEAIRILVIVFLLYQGLSVMIMTLCEDNGLFSMFKTQEQNGYSAIVCRLIAFTLRFLLRVATPFCCTWHIPIMASKPSIPKTGLTQQQAIPRMFKVHSVYSSEEEVEELQRHPETVFEQSVEMTKRRIKAIWIPMTNAVVLVALLLYLGAFLACESNTMKGGVCSSLDRTIVTLPLLHVQIHLIIWVESFSVAVTLLLLGIALNCYYHENTIAKYAVTIGKEAESVHHSVRRRWILMDCYGLMMPYILASITLLSLSTGQTITPAPSHQPEAYELVDWYFWIINITVLQYLGFSCNRMTKIACLYGYILSAVLVYWVDVEVTKVPYGSVMVLLYCGLTALCFNILYSLGTCHLRHARETGSLSSYIRCLFCLLSQFLLIASLVVTVYREVAHLATYVVHML